MPSPRTDGRKNFQAWISPEAFDALALWCHDAGITKTAYLEAIAEWMTEHPFEMMKPNAFILRARRITAESRARERG